jgi:alpha-glucosidase (family GH31 glycosyl hydrolase)
MAGSSFFSGMTGTAAAEAARVSQLACRARRHAFCARKAVLVLCAFVILSAAPLMHARTPPKQSPGVGNLDNVAVQDDTLTLRAGPDTMIVQVVEPNILRVHYEPGGQTSQPSAVLDPNRTWPNDIPAKIDTSSDPIAIFTDEMVVKISKTPLRLAICDRADHLLLEEPKDGGVYSGGVRFSSTIPGPFFGIDATSIPGENADAHQDIRVGVVRSGGAVRAGRQGDGGAPLIYTAAYGLLVDSNGGNFNLSNALLQFSAGSRPDTEYFAIVGDPQAIMHAVADISGHPPMMPKWTLGFLNSQFGTTQAEVTQIIDTYRAKQIPIDGFILDFDWKAWGEDDYGEWRWNSTSAPGNVSPDKYPDGASGKFAQEMRDNGIKLVGIYKPRILLHNVQGDLTDAAKYAYDHHFFFDREKPYNDYFSNRPALDIDFSKPEARAWFWQHMIPAYRAGIQYFWNDEADSIFDLLFPNLQSEDMERAMYEGARSMSDQRVWSIDRNFYLGAQRYAYAEWSGDISTGFSSMAWQEPRMLSTISLGEPHWTMDTGGFNGNPDPENYARWMQFAAFVPIMRVHGNFNDHRQPWVYGEQAEADAKAAIDLRYRLVPYMYAYERRAHDTGVGIVRPLFWEFPEGAARTVDITDEWMFGDDLLVAPIVQQGQEHCTIYLPPGQWFDYFRGQRYDGGGNIVYSVDPHTWSDIPLFVRAGAILPTEDVRQYVGQHPVTRVYLDVFPTSAQTTFRYYDDDGITYAYQKGVFYEQLLSARDDGTVVHFDSAAPTGRYVPALRDYEVRLHGIRGRAVALDGAAAKRCADLAQLETAGAPGWTTGADQYGPVTFVLIPAQSAQHVTATR